MPVRIALEVSKPGVLDVQLARIPNVLRTEIKTLLEQQLEEALAWMVRSRMSGPPSRPGQVKSPTAPLGQLTGNLVRSFRVTVKESATEVVGQIGQDQRFRSKAYAAIHEFGGIIRARAAQYLTIPWTEEARSRPARSIPGLFVIKSRAGNLFLMRKRGGALEPMYLLKKEVRMPARPYLAPTAEKFFPRIARNMLVVLNRALARELKNA